MKEPTLRRGRAVAWLPLVMTLLWGAGATQAEAQHVHRHSSSVEGYFIADFLGEYRLRVDGERRASGDLGPLGNVKANLSWTQLSLNAGMHYAF
ncbi:MAG: hypothetical protein IPG17_22870 [Sandaracinaceae bacterium]|nr:hypothetical protein [Sandaracinaceae bacterium]MBP7685833.1 hypothetical protein [Deltaproteobacteria bacterium]